MSEKNLKFSIQGGGVFSRLLQCGIIPLADKEFDNLYLSAYPFPIHDLRIMNDYYASLIVSQLKNFADYGIEDPYARVFDYVLDQKCDSSYEDGGYLHIGKLYTSEDKIELSPRFRDYKTVASRLRFKNSLMKNVALRSQAINWDKTLAVHVRLTTMNQHGHDYADFNTYLRIIEKSLKNFNYDSLFVSSDNIESIRQLRECFGSIVIYNEDFQRTQSQNEPSSKWEMENFFKMHYWTEAVIDAMMLAKSKKLICRTSNFSNAAILFGNYEEIIRI
jgi:hypothetical protein